MATRKAAAPADVPVEDTTPIPGVPIDPNEPSRDPAAPALIVNLGLAGGVLDATLGTHDAVLADVVAQNDAADTAAVADWERQVAEDELAAARATDNAQKAKTASLALQAQVQQAVDAGTINPGLVAALKLLNVVR